MIPSTRPMMLQAALDLSNLVQDQKAVYWDDVEQLSNYTEKLKKIVLKLETQVGIKHTLNTFLSSLAFVFVSLLLQHYIFLNSLFVQYLGKAFLSNVTWLFLFQNTYLTGQHVAIRNIVQKLIETELLAKQSEWKKGVKEMRHIVDTVGIPVKCYKLFCFTDLRNTLLTLSDPLLLFLLKQIRYKYLFQL